MKHSANHHNRHFFASLVMSLTLALVTGCASAPKLAASPGFQPAPPQLVTYALSLQGAPYRQGKSSPQEGFDCSSFVRHVYQHYGIYLPRTSGEMAQSFPLIENDELQPGDLVFFNTNGDTYSHVGLFVKNSEFVHAPSLRTGKVLLSSLNNRYWRNHFTGARRPAAVRHSTVLVVGHNSQGSSRN